MDIYKPTYLIEEFNEFAEVLGQECMLYAPSATPVEFDCMILSLDFKSNMKGLSDNTVSIKYSRDCIVKKGDLIVDEDSNTYIVSWKPFKEINCYSAQAQLCTDQFTFERWIDVVLDADGNSATPAQYESIAVDVDGFIARINSKYYESNQGQVGIFASQRVGIGIQYNDTTRLIKIEDEFSFGGKQYLITDIDLTQLNTGRSDGIIFVFAEIIEGDRK